MRKDYEQTIFAGIFLLSNRLQTSGDQILDEISVKQWLLLLIISKMNSEAASISEVARVFQSSRQNVKKIVDVLEKKGFVVTGKHTTDRRNLSIVPTEKTWKYFSEFETRGNEFLDVLFQGMPNGALEQLIEAMAKMQENLDLIDRNNKEKDIVE